MISLPDARARLCERIAKNPGDDFLTQLLVLFDRMERQRDAVMVAMLDSDRLRLDMREERDAALKRIGELEALLAAPVRAAATVPPEPTREPRAWQTTAIDRIRAEQAAKRADFAPWSANEPTA